ncbi:MAG: hypothetical protein NTW25_14050 [Candidatus Kapabacteria bacterium]|nr:hypothetical protein [Candidatus Kapabacteria bacterium]
MKNISKFLLLSSLIVLFTITSCKKDTVISPSNDESTQSSTDNALVDGEFSSIFSFVTSQGDASTSSEAERKEAGIQNNGKSDQLPDCATVTFDSVKKTVLIDFGSKNCLCKDGRYRRGQILFTFTGVWKSVGSSVTVAVSNYFIQDMEVKGSKTISFLSPTSINITVSNAIKQTKGMLTKNVNIDDEYEITGSSSGINRKGVGFSVVISNENPLVKKLSCLIKDFVSGIITISNNKGSTMVVNFNPDGSYDCNKNAVVTLNGKVSAITLR